MLNVFSIFLEIVWSSDTTELTMEVLMHHVWRRVVPSLPRTLVATPCRNHSSCAGGHATSPAPTYPKQTTPTLLVSRLFQPSNLRDMGGQESRAAGELTCKSQRLMQQAGLIHPSSPGCYYYLPATVRSMEKLVRM